jgi:uncharacterized protein with GYD domain
MPKYLIEASYSPEGVKGIASKGGTSRVDAVSHMAEALGGKLESFYFALGEVDAYVTVDLPDTEAVTACALAVNASGLVSVKTVQLLAPEEVDAAAKLSAEYRPPGG